tara:strand:- start:1639 stop:3042 length:1404 start_codon:yes stop_codon:yes gene_type:complete
LNRELTFNDQLIYSGALLLADKKERKNMLHFQGTFVDISPSGTLRIHDQSSLVCDAQGKITWIGDTAEAKKRFPNATLHTFQEGSFVLPGFVDCHIHFPQNRIIGAVESDLLHWLDHHVWPEERKYKDEAFSKMMAQEFVHNLLSNGTTAALVFGSQFSSATDHLFEEGLRQQMALVTGLTLQDRHTHPELEYTAREIRPHIESMISKWHQKERLRYVVTSRFSPACSPSLLKMMGEIIKQDSSLYFQTHINESHAEIEWVKQLFPECEDYLASYEQFDLLTSRSVFAHSIHTTEHELKRMGQHQCSVAHCPSSNAFLGSGSFSFKKHKEHDVQIAMGSDVAAGVSFSLWREMGHAHLIQMRLPEEERTFLDATQMLSSVTIDGAKALRLDHEIGNFESGKWADFIVFHPSKGRYLSKRFDECKDNSGHIDPKYIQKLLFQSALSYEDDMISHTFVKGKPVFQRECD